MLLSAALIFMPEMEAKLSAVILFVLLDVSTLQAFPNNICVARRQILLASEVRQLNVIFFSLCFVHSQILLNKEGNN